MCSRHTLPEVTDNYHEMYTVYTLLYDLLCTADRVQQQIGKCCCDIICSPASHHSYSIRNVFRMAITDYKIFIVA